MEKMKYILLVIAALVILRYLLRHKGVFMKNMAEPLVRDPVCGTYVPRQKELSLRTQDGTLYFCSAACRQRFTERKS